MIGREKSVTELCEEAKRICATIECVTCKHSERILLAKMVLHTLETASIEHYLENVYNLEKAGAKT